MIRIIKIISPLIVVGIFLLALSILFDYQPLHALQSDQLFQSVRKSFIVEDKDKDIPFVVVGDDAVESLKQVIELDPNYCVARVMLGVHYFSKTFGGGKNIKPGDPYDVEAASASIHEFEQSIQRCPETFGDSFAHYYLAEEYYYSNQPLKALEQINIIMAKNPQGTKAGSLYDLRANVYDSIGDVKNTYNSLRSSLFYEEKQNLIIDKIIRLNKYIKQNPELTQDIMPESAAGFGRYTTAVITRDQKIHIIGAPEDKQSLFHFSLEGNKWVPKDILLVKNGFYGRMDIDSQDKIHLAYASGNNIYYVSDLNQGINNIVAIDTSGLFLSSVPSTPMPVFLQLALSKDGKAYIVWANPAYGIMYSTISNNESPTKPEFISQDGQNISFIVSDTDNIYAAFNKRVYAEFPSSDVTAWFRAKINGVWNDPIQIGQNGVWTGGVSMAIAPNQTIHLVYITSQSADNAKLMHISITPQGIWSKPEIIGEGDYRPWIPENYGGNYTAAISILNDNSLAVAWRIPGDDTGTPLVGRKLSSSGWEPVSTLAFIHGIDYLDSPSVVKQAEPLENVVKLIWTDNGKIILLDWNP